MYRTVEFTRFYDRSKVHIVPDHVVKVEPWIDGEEDEQPYNSSIVLSAGNPEIVEGPPSEVNKKLQQGV